MLHEMEVATGWRTWCASARLVWKPDHVRKFLGRMQSPRTSGAECPLECNSKKANQNVRCNLQQVCPMDKLHRSCASAVLRLFDASWIGCHAHGEHHPMGHSLRLRQALPGVNLPFTLVPASAAPMWMLLGIWSETKSPSRYLSICKEIYLFVSLSISFYLIFSIYLYILYLFVSKHLYLSAREAAASLVSTTAWSHRFPQFLMLGLWPYIWW